MLGDTVSVVEVVVVLAQREAEQEEEGEDYETETLKILSIKYANGKIANVPGKLVISVNGYNDCGGGGGGNKPKH